MARARLEGANWSTDTRSRCPRTVSKGHAGTPESVVINMAADARGRPAKEEREAAKLEMLREQERDLLDQRSQPIR